MADGRLRTIHTALNRANTSPSPDVGRAHPLHIAVLLGTTREGRQGHRAAQFVKRFLEAEGHTVTLVDPLATPLPMLEKAYQHYDEDELPRPPVLEQLGQIMNSADALVCVSAEYNHTIPPALTNLLGHFGPSFLLQGKPAGLCTYSAAWHGGRFAAAHLRGLCGELGMVTIPNIHSIGAVYEQLDPDGYETEIGSGANVASRFGRFATQLAWYAAALRNHRDVHLAP
jgi:NAD(P)H-dependent FMN reductase